MVCCPRLVGLFSLLQEWVESLGETFSVPLFVFGPQFSVKKRWTLVLINFFVWYSQAGNMEN